jgi:hypothetical protein
MGGVNTDCTDAVFAVFSWGINGVLIGGCLGGIIPVVCLCIGIGIGGLNMG